MFHGPEKVSHRVLANHRVKRCPNPDAAGACDIEIRQVYEPEDFAPAFSEEDISRKKASALNWQIR